MRRNLLLAAILTAAFGGTATAGMDQFQWEKRPLVMAVPSADNAAYRQQLEVAATHAEGFAERDMVIIAVVGDERVEVDGGPAAGLEGGDIRRRLDLPQARFEVVLVGKDGTVKLRSTRAIPASVLFQTIDAMPMRRREMRENRGDRPDDQGQGPRRTRKGIPIGSEIGITAPKGPAGAMASERKAHPGGEVRRRGG